MSDSLHSLCCQSTANRDASHLRASQTLVLCSTGPLRGNVTITCFLIIFFHQFLQICRSVNLREENKAAALGRRREDAEERSPVITGAEEGRDEGQQEQWAHTSSMKLIVPVWDRKYVSDKVFSPSIELSTCLTMQLHISSLVGFVVWSAFFYEGVNKSLLHLQYLFFPFQCLREGFDLICIYEFIL